MLKLFVGKDKNEPVLMLATNIANAQTMVDASTKLYFAGNLYLPPTLNFQGHIDPGKILNHIKHEEKLCTQLN